MVGNSKETGVPCSNLIRSIFFGSVDTFRAALFLIKFGLSYLQVKSAYGMQPKYDMVQARVQAAIAWPVPAHDPVCVCVYVCVCRLRDLHCCL